MKFLTRDPYCNERERNNLNKEINLFTNFLAERNNPKLLGKERR